jgi:hypothetical protein
VSANIAWFPDTDWVCVVHSNYDNGARDIAGMAQRLITENGRTR